MRPDTRVRLHVNSPLLLFPDLMQNCDGYTFLVKLPNIVFHKHPFSRAR